MLAHTTLVRFHSQLNTSIKNARNYTPCVGGWWWCVWDQIPDKWMRRRGFRLCKFVIISLNFSIRICCLCVLLTRTIFGGGFAHRVNWKWNANANHFWLFFGVECVGKGAVECIMSCCCCWMAAHMPFRFWLWTAKTISSPFNRIWFDFSDNRNFGEWETLVNNDDKRKYSPNAMSEERAEWAMKQENI